METNECLEVITLAHALFNRRAVPRKTGNESSKKHLLVFVIYNRARRGTSDDAIVRSSERASDEGGSRPPTNYTERTDGWTIDGQAAARAAAVRCIRISVATGD